MKLLRNTIYGWRYKHWTLKETVAYFIKGIARELKIAPIFFFNWHEKIAANSFNKRWLKKTGNEPFFDFNGAKIPAMLEPGVFRFLRYTFDDVFLFSCFYNDKYEKDFVCFMDKYVMDEGPYSYSDNIFKVAVEKGDVVIDAGAWIGDFSAYAVSKGAIVYAFEPEIKLYELLCKTQELNCIDGEACIIPVKKGLGSSKCEMALSVDESAGEGNSLVFNRGTGNSVLINVTTLDLFVQEKRIEKIDFIKADIEGAERELLKGATNVLKTFAPKLAICTYHLPDDPEVLEKIIKDANPNYQIVHLRKKLFAAVVK